MKEVRRTPYSYSSKEPESSEAAHGRDIYVIEVRIEENTRRYALGYRYQSTEKFSRPGSLWKDEFKFKNSATPGTPAVGVYYEPFVEISDVEVVEWLTSKQPGMAQIPAGVLAALQRVEAGAATSANRFK